MKKGIWRSQISWLFLNSLWTFRKSRKIFLVFHSVLRWSRRCGLIQPPPHSRNIQKPRPIRVNNNLICEIQPNILFLFCSFSDEYQRNMVVAKTETGWLQFRMLESSETIKNLRRLKLQLTRKDLISLWKVLIKGLVKWIRLPFERNWNLLYIRYWVIFCSVKV